MQEESMTVGKSSFLCCGFNFLFGCYQDELYPFYETVKIVAQVWVLLIQ